MPLIKTGIVTYKIDVPDADIREALIFEAAEKHGLTHDGKIIPGVRGQVTYDGRRGGGTYTVHLTRNIAESGQQSLPSPGVE
jgi:hypothetical protein